METTVARLDRLIARLLLLQPRTQASAPQQDTARSAEQAFGFSIVFSGVRCIIQYVILPFVLPILGIAGELAAHITLLINVLAIGALLFSLRRFWRINYSHKWTYLAIALPALVILSAFLYFDLQAVL